MSPQMAIPQLRIPQGALPHRDHRLQRIASVYPPISAKINR